MEEDYKEYNKYIKAKKKVDEIKGFYIHLTVYIVVNAFLMIPILKYSNPNEISIWSFSTAIFWGIGLLFHAYGVFGKNIIFSKDWEERKIKELMDKDKKEYWE
ncbi:MAG: 2TM domain-containing protein [Bacteroidota bacterium]